MQIFGVVRTDINAATVINREHGIMRSLGDMTPIRRPA